MLTTGKTQEDKREIWRPRWGGEAAENGTTCRMSLSALLL